MEEKQRKPIKIVGERLQNYGDRTRRYPVFELSRSDMFHVLRHTCASVQLEAGEAIAGVSVWLGHSSPEITLDHYAHFTPGAGFRAWPRYAQVKDLIGSGADMSVKYKETARGGLAVNIIEC